MNPLIPVSLRGAANLPATFPGEHVFAESLIIGMPYVGDASIGPELDSMLFYVTSIENLGPDMANMSDPDMIELVVTVGSETWELIVPADGTAVLVDTDCRDCGTELDADGNKTCSCDIAYGRTSI